MSNLNKLKNRLVSGKIVASKNILNNLHPSELARLIESMPLNERAIIWEMIDQKIEEGFKPSDKPSSAPKSRNFRGRSNFTKGKPGKRTFSKGKPGGGGKPSFAKGKSGSSGKPVNKKSGSKAKTRWKKTKKT